MPPLEASHSPHAPHEMEYSRKRTHSVAEGLSPQGIVRDQLNDRHPPPGGWAAQESAAQVHQYGPGYYAQPSQHASYNEQIQMAVNGAHSERGLPQSRTAMSSNEMRHQEGDVHEAVNFQWDEALVDEYVHISVICCILTNSNSGSMHISKLLYHSLLIRNTYYARRLAKRPLKSVRHS